MVLRKTKVKKGPETARLEARISPAVKEMIELAASLQGRTVTDFVVAAADAQARQVISDHQIIKLSMDDSVAFVEAMLNPPEPTKEALMAAKRYRERKSREF